ncbi:uncharacterized protein BX663DRAFT_510784, partial [Cokeromyces recurvatus]|uniref:uncharacterized protein n=1 Tax=Cokeromyces recurvatus TaxID=90255 RepID=UPI00221EEE44
APFENIVKNFLKRVFISYVTGRVLFCFPLAALNLIIDLILWLPMIHNERSRTIRWRLGWLPGGIPKACPYHPYVHF